MRGKRSEFCPTLVMAGLDPAIHAADPELWCSRLGSAARWVCMDTRVKPAYDAAGTPSPYG